MDGKGLELLKKISSPFFSFILRVNEIWEMWINEGEMFLSPLLLFLRGENERGMKVNKYLFFFAWDY